MIIFVIICYGNKFYNHSLPPPPPPPLQFHSNYDIFIYFYLFIFIHINILWYTSTYSLKSSNNNDDNNNICIYIYIKAIEIVSSYKYLGLVLNEFLDFQITAKVVSQSASRALGLLISKDKAFGGKPYECFSKCYDALVQSIINYGAAVWGSTGYSCIAAVQNRACRFLLDRPYFSIFDILPL